MDQHNNQWMRDDYGDQELSMDGSCASSSLSDADSYISYRSLKHQEQEDEQAKNDEEEHRAEQSASEESSEQQGGALDCRTEQVQAYYIPNQKITSAYMSKYEFALVIGKRAQQISKNSPLYVEIDEKEAKKYDVLQIAEMELRAGKLPYILRRNLPNGYFEDWKVSELAIPDQL